MSISGYNPNQNYNVGMGVGGMSAAYGNVLNNYMNAQSQYAQQAQQYASRKLDIQHAHDTNLAAGLGKAAQFAIGHGLGNTTIRGSMEGNLGRGYNEDQMRALASLTPPAMPYYYGQYAGYGQQGSGYGNQGGEGSGYGSGGQQHSYAAPAGNNWITNSAPGQGGAMLGSVSTGGGGGGYGHPRMSAQDYTSYGQPGGSGQTAQGAMEAMGATGNPFANQSLMAKATADSVAKTNEELAAMREKQDSAGGVQSPMSRGGLVGAGGGYGDWQPPQSSANWQPPPPPFYPSKESPSGGSHYGAEMLPSDWVNYGGAEE